MIRLVVSYETLLNGSGYGRVIGLRQELGSHRVMTGLAPEIVARPTAGPEVTLLLCGLLRLRGRGQIAVGFQLASAFLWQRLRSTFSFQLC